MLGFGVTAPWLSRLSKVSETVGCVWSTLCCGFDQAVALDRPDSGPHRLLQQELAHLPGQPGRNRQGGAPEDVLRDNVRRTARGELGLLGYVVRFYGNVHRRIAHADHYDLFPLQLGVVPVVVRMHLEAVENPLTATIPEDPAPMMHAGFGSH